MTATRAASTTKASYAYRTFLEERGVFGGRLTWRGFAAGIGNLVSVSDRKRRRLDCRERVAQSLLDPVNPRRHARVQPHLQIIRGSHRSVAGLGRRDLMNRSSAQLAPRSNIFETLREIRNQVLHILNAD
jgi:hypothetical protein